MVLITGGSFQGKLDYALALTGLLRTQVTEGENCSLESLCNIKILNNFHEIIKRRLRNEEEITQFVQQLIRDNPEIIIIVNEIGCGLVPMDSFERNYRETTGRMCCELAKQAKQVYRVVCGIGRMIKGD